MVTVLIGTSEPLTLQELRLELSRIEDVEVVGEASDEQHAFGFIRTLRPNLVLLDKQMLRPDAIQSAPFLAGAAGSNLRFLSSFEPNSTSLTRAEASAVNCLFKPVRPELLRNAVDDAREVAAQQRTAAWNSRMDRIGQSVSLLCAIHCAIMPFVIGLLAVLGADWVGSRSFEWGIVAISTVIAACTLLPGYSRHGHRRSLFLFSLGLASIFIARLWLDETSAFELPAVVAGGALIAVAHGINRKLCRSCQDCGQPGPLREKSAA